MITDKLIHATAADNQLRCMAAVTTNLVAEACRARFEDKYQPQFLEGQPHKAIYYFFQNLAARRRRRTEADQVGRVPVARSLLFTQEPVSFGEKQ